MTRQKLLQLDYVALIHPPYSPDTAPSDVHLFQSSQNSLNGKSFNSPEDWKRHLEKLFAQKGEKFWEDGIVKLPEKLLKAVEQSIEYIVQ